MEAAQQETQFNSTGPELNILVTLSELCVTDGAETLSREFTWKFLLDRLPLGVVRKHEGDLWWGKIQPESAGDKLMEIYHYIYLLLHLLNIQKRSFFQCL